MLTEEVEAETPGTVFRTSANRLALRAAISSEVIITERVSKSSWDLASPVRMTKTPQRQIKIPAKAFNVFPITTSKTTKNPIKIS
jgi:hypothetical protein